MPLETETAPAARASREAALRQLRDSLLPRLRDLDAPLLAVVGGSTGSGKSTLVNSLLGFEASTPGVLRPTTRSPVLAHHPGARRWFEDDRVLGSFARVRGGPASGPHELLLVEAATLPENLALLDTPDIDSVLDLNRETAARLLDAADVWVFVTTAARYADAIPWTFLATAARRGVAIALVLDRVPPDALDEVRGHLRTMLADEGLDDAPVFTIAEQPLEDGRLPAAVVDPVRGWLHQLAGTAEQRADVVRRSLDGMVAEASARAVQVAETVEHQSAVAAWLGDRVDEAFGRAREQLAVDVRDGTVMRGEVLARWQDLVGTGELLRELQSRIGRARDRLAAAATGRPRHVERFQGAVESGVETLVRERVQEAYERVGLTWRSLPAGTALLDAGPEDLSRPSAEIPERIARLVRDWQGALLDLLRQEGAGKRAAAKVLSYGVNGAALVVMVGVFAQTGGLTGAEIAIAGGSTALGSTLLEALLGDQAVRRLADRARADLDRRIADLLDTELGRFHHRLDEHRPDAGTASRLTGLAADLRAQVAA